jgi:UDP-3-O-[3-hydroxymyristoyl] N-acetylglucosamine deacetylase
LQIVSGMERSIIWQQTLTQPLSFSGIGLHLGLPVQVTIYPAAANYGLRFVRADLPDRPEIEAHYSKVVDTIRATTLGDGIVTLSTVEHLLAALRSAGVDNACIEVEGPEVPIMDGSAAPFAQLLAKTGLRTLPWLRPYLRVHRPVELREGDQWIRVLPGEPRITYSINFSHPLIRRQRFSVPLLPGTFEREIAPARTFGFLKEVQYLKTNGLALGGSLDNALVLDDSRVLNPGGFRFPEECVRHKILDAMGDLALLGIPLFGRLEVSRGSHELHYKFLQHLMDQEASWHIWVPSPRVREKARAFVQPTLWEGMPA